MTEHAHADPLVWTSPDSEPGTAEPTAPARPTHEVLNQPPPPLGLNPAHDPALREATDREGAGWVLEELEGLGARASTPLAFDWAQRANSEEPELRTHDRMGHRIDEVVYHPAWHELMRTAVAHGLQAQPWQSTRPGAHVARAARFLVWGQVESGHLCPMSMTYAAVGALRAQPELAAHYEPQLAATTYDPALRPPQDKPGLLAGMAMTEKQGGSDVRRNTTVAEPTGGGGPGAEHRLTGHKWFCSAPMSDLLLVLANTEAGLGCFVVPRVLPDGTRNAVLLQRLKDKLGNRSNASAELELDGALGWMVGEEGRGVRTIIEMVARTRLDCAVGSAALQRAALTQALHHTRFRSAFGASLAEQPLMRNVLADLAVESEAATALALRLAGAADRSEHDAHEAALRRLGASLGKYWVCKRTPTTVAEAMECLGGNGYVEESGLPRHYREAPVNSIWEGSGNVLALDILRALAKEPASLEAFHDEVARAEGADPRLDAAAKRLRDELADTEAAQLRARRLVERMALVWQGALLVRHAPPAVADAFTASRLDGDGGLALGTLPAGCDLAAILDRADLAPA